MECSVCGKLYMHKYSLQSHKHTNNHFLSGEYRARSGRLALLLLRWRIANGQHLSNADSGAAQSG